MAKQQAQANADQSERLSKHVWIVAALQEVGNGGVAQVRIEVLARALGVTKGSFYWHFKDRDALLGEMLRFWQQSLTSAVGRFVRTKIETPRDRLSYLLGLASEDQRRPRRNDRTCAARMGAVFRTGAPRHLRGR